MLFCSSGRKTKSAVEKKNKMDTTRLISFEEKRSIGKIANLLGHHDYEYAQPQHQFSFFFLNETCRECTPFLLIKLKPRKAKQRQTQHRFSWPRKAHTCQSIDTATASSIACLAKRI